MSAEIQDEVEALNSIYGPSTLSPTDSPTSLVLNLPGDARTALRLTVPASYPDAPPEVHSTFSAGEASRGDAAARQVNARPPETCAGCIVPTAGPRFVTIPPHFLPALSSAPARGLRTRRAA